MSIIVSCWVILNLYLITKLECEYRKLKNKDNEK